MPRQKLTFVICDDQTGKATLFKGTHYKQALAAWREGKTALLTIRGQKTLEMSLKDYEESFITVKKLVK